jgi:hypothetical protein
MSVLFSRKKLTTLLSKTASKRAYVVEAFSIRRYYFLVFILLKMTTYIHGVMLPSAT